MEAGAQEDTAVGMVDQMVSPARPTLASLYTVERGFFWLSEAGKGSPESLRATERTISVK